MQLGDLIAAVAPTETLGDRAVAVIDLAYDTRAVRPGSLFFCVPGMRVDGHELADDAVARGAVALVVERPLAAAVPQLVVADAREAMARAAVAFFGDPTAELEVAGVTGTAGKTTTAFLLYEILEAAGRRPGLVGTIESRVGGKRRPAVRTTPEAVDLQRTFRAMLDAGDRSCALEATSHGSELKRLAGVRFAALAFTNLSEEHLDLHGTMERYFDAKRRLFTERERPRAAVNVGDPYGERLADELRALGDEPATFALADVARLELTPSGTRFTYGGVDYRLHLPGRFNVVNALAAIVSARLLGIDEAAIAAGIERLRGVPGRFELVDEGQPFTVVVDYSHKPDALSHVLSTARELAAGRVLCVFGAGGDRDRAKRPLMGRVAAELADLAIVTSDNPRSEDPLAIIDEVVAGAGEGVEVEPDRRTAIERAIELAGVGDVVVVAGKGHEQGQEVAGRVLPFDDREIARQALRRVRAGA